MTKHNSKLCGGPCAATNHCADCQAYKRRRGRPITVGKLYRELGITRQQAWKCGRLAQIPKDQFEELLENPWVHGCHLGTNGMLRAAGLLSPDRPRPPERARAKAVEILDVALYRATQLRQELLENGSESELTLATETCAAVNTALNTLRRGITH